jgi:hypothetical protein
VQIWHPLPTDTAGITPANAGGRGGGAIHQSAQNLGTQALQARGFSVGRLMTILTALGSDIEIRIRPPKRSSSPGRILVDAA